MRPVLLVAAVVAFVVALASIPHVASDGPPLRDFEAYYAAGQTWRYGGDAYARDVWRSERLVPGVVATRDELLPFVGPPYGLPLWSALGGLSFASASLVWALALGLAATTVVLGSLRLAAGRFAWPQAIAALLFAAAFAPLTGGVALGQVALVSCAAIVVLPALLRPRLMFVAACGTLVAALQPNLALVLAARASDARARVTFGAAALVAALGSALALGGPEGFAQYLAVLRDHGAAERFIAIQTSPGAVAYALGAPPAVAGGFALALAAVVVVTLGVQCTRGAFAPDARLMLACAALPLALPFAHEHDYAIVFLPALVLVVRARKGAWAWSACAALALAVDWLGLAQRPNAMGATLAFSMAGACALAALAPGRLAPYHATPLALVAAAVATAGRIAATHRLPVWPDALPLHFHVAATLPAAVVWRAEQVATGIAARDPVWGALRAIDLVACAVVWAVATVVLRDDRARTAVAPPETRFARD